jgi:hypothetical protein
MGVIRQSFRWLRSSLLWMRLRANLGFSGGIKMDEEVIRQRMERHQKEIEFREKLLSNPRCQTYQDDLKRVRQDIQNFKLKIKELYWVLNFAQGG